MSQESPQLHYTPFVPWHGPKKVRQRIILLLLVALGIFTGVRWVPPVWHRIDVYWAQRQCLNYFAPQGQLIYATPAGDRFLRNETSAFRQPPPSCWLGLGSSLPDPWGGHFGPLAPAPVFLHSRTISGRKRLVAVQFGEQVLNANLQLVLRCRIFDPATLFHDPRLIDEESAAVASSLWTESAKVFAGKSDESDSSHFVIEITVDGQPKTIDGWLQNDDTVKLQSD